MSKRVLGTDGLHGTLKVYNSLFLTSLFGVAAQDWVDATWKLSALMMVGLITEWLVDIWTLHIDLQV